MKEIENIIKKNLPEKKNDDGFAHDPSVAFNEGFDEAIDRIPVSLIADEVLKEIESILDSFCVMVKNELKQQRLDGFSLDGTDFDEVFKSAEKTILSTLSPNTKQE